MSKQWAIWSAIALAAAASGSSAIAQEKIKVGFMLPFSGTYAALGVAIENGFRMQVAEQGGKLGGREIEYFKVDDEYDPAKATDNVNRHSTSMPRCWMRQVMASAVTSNANSSGRARTGSYGTENKAPSSSSLM